MKNKIHLIIIITLLVTFKSDLLTGSHVIGGGITYQWLGGNDYMVRFYKFEDCNFGNANTINIIYSSASCGYTDTATLSINSAFFPMNTYCQSVGNPCNNSTNYIYSGLRYIEGIVTLPFQCYDWKFSVDICCRSSYVSNLYNSAAHSLYFESSLNNLDFPGNNSPDLNSVPRQVINMNMNTNIDFSCSNTDGDSLVYELANPLSTSSNVVINIPYVSGYSAIQPINSIYPNIINSNGILSLFPSTLQNSIIKVAVKEYRQGIFVGAVSFEYAISVIPGINYPPQITGINGTNDSLISVCVGDTLNFDIYGSDPDSGQSLIYSLSGPLTNAIMVSNGPNSNSVNLNWIPNSSYMSSTPYKFTFKVADDFCPANHVANKDIYITVLGCNSNDVWPGDINFNGVANVYDLLPLAIALGNSGPIRPSASLSWSPQPATNWSSSFNNSINYKHADTNGDGFVTLNDTLAISQNYGLSHPLRIEDVTIQNNTTLSIISNYNVAGPSTEITFDFYFSTPVDSIYGIAFNTVLNPQQIDLTSISLDYISSALGTVGVDMIKMDKIFLNNGLVEVGFSRINQTNFTGAGLLVRLKATTKSIINNVSTLYIEASSIVANSAFDTPVTVTSIGKSISIVPNFVGMHEPSSEPIISVYPNPASEHFVVSINNNSSFDSVTLYNTESKEIFNSYEKTNLLKVELSAINQGVYFLKVVVNQKEFYKKIVVL